MNDFYSVQLELIKAFQQIRNPVIDGFFKFIGLIDTPSFFFILILVVWIGYHWKMGLRLTYIMVLSGLVNYALKQLFELPRPFHLDPTVGVIQVSGYGFPSGAAQSAILLPGILLYYFRNKWSWIVAINFAFWVSLSRIYLGVHFFNDILGGWVIGISLLLFFIYILPIAEKYFTTLNSVTLLGVSLLPPLILLYFFRASFVIQLCSVAMGVGVGLFILRWYPFFLMHPKSRKEWLLRVALIVGSAYMLYVANLLFPIQNLNVRVGVQFFILGAWLSLALTLLWSSFRVRTKR